MQISLSVRGFTQDEIIKRTSKKKIMVNLFIPPLLWKPRFSEAKRVTAHALDFQPLSQAKA